MIPDTLIDGSLLSLQQLWRYGAVFLGGLVLGLIFYGGLWLTVRRVLTAQQPALLTVSSFVIRTGLTLLGLYWISDGRVDRIAVAMIGFLLMRAILLRRFGPPRLMPPSTQERLLEDAPFADHTQEDVLGKGERSRADHAG